MYINVFLHGGCQRNSEEDLEWKFWVVLWVWELSLGPLDLRSISPAFLNLFMPTVYYYNHLHLNIRYINQI